MLLFVCLFFGHEESLESTNFFLWFFRLAASMAASIMHAPMQRMI